MRGKFKGHQLGGGDRLASPGKDAGLSSLGVNLYDEWMLSYAYRFIQCLSVNRYDLPRRLAHQSVPFIYADTVVTHVFARELELDLALAIKKGGLPNGYIGVMAILP